MTDQDTAFSVREIRDEDSVFHVRVMDYNRILVGFHGLSVTSDEINMVEIYTPDETPHICDISVGDIGVFVEFEF